MITNRSSPRLEASGAFDSGRDHLGDEKRSEDTDSTELPEVHLGNPDIRRYWKILTCKLCSVTKKLSPKELTLDKTQDLNKRGAKGENAAVRSVSKRKKKYSWMITRGQNLAATSYTSDAKFPCRK